MKAIQVLHGLSAVIFVTVGVAAGPFHVEGAGQFRSTRARVARASLKFGEIVDSDAAGVAEAQLARNRRLSVTSTT